MSPHSQGSGAIMFFGTFVKKVCVCSVFFWQVAVGFRNPKAEHLGCTEVRKPFREFGSGWQCHASTGCPGIFLERTMGGVF